MWNPVVFECIVCNKSLHKINHQPCKLPINMGKVSNNSIRRSRTPNWSIEEKQHLLELIRQRKLIVTKSNNGPNYSEEKDVAWNEILSQLAAKFGNKFIGFSIKKVKTQWQNMKRIAREEISICGGDLTKFTRQSLDVCCILDMVKDGVLVVNEHETTTSDPLITTNVEIKTERIDEEPQPDVNAMDGATMDISDCQPHQPIGIIPQAESNASSEHTSDLYECDNVEESVHMPEAAPTMVTSAKKNASVMTMTDMSFRSEPTVPFVNPYQRDLQEFFRYSHTEKQLKIDNLREERQVTRALRETAELNKIIAEQKLKHVLWMRRQDPRIKVAKESTRWFSYAGVNVE